MEQRSNQTGPLVTELTAVDIQGTKVTNTGADWLKEHSDAKVFH